MSFPRAIGINLGSFVQRVQVRRRDVSRRLAGLLCELGRGGADRSDTRPDVLHAHEHILRPLADGASGLRLLK